MKTLKASLFVMFAAFLAVGFNACSDDYEDGEIIKDTYTGDIEITSTGSDPAGNFTGDGDSGTFSFAWVNAKNRAEVNFDVTTSGGSVRMIIEDSEGTVVLDKTRPAGGEDSYSGVTQAGVSGTWIVKLVLEDFTGDGSYSLSPGT